MHVETAREDQLRNEFLLHHRVFGLNSMSDAQTRVGRIAPKGLFVNCECLSARLLETSHQRWVANEIRSQCLISRMLPDSRLYLRHCEIELRSYESRRH